MDGSHFGNSRYSHFEYDGIMSKKIHISSESPFHAGGNVLALWHDEKSKNVHYAVVRLHDLDEARLIRIEAQLAEIKQLLEVKK